MKVQACTFKRESESDSEDGIIFLKKLDVYNGELIIDSNGKEVSEVWSFRLISGPLSYIDTSYGQ